MVVGGGVLFAFACATSLLCVCVGGAEEIALVVYRLWALSVGGKNVLFLFLGRLDPVFFALFPPPSLSLSRLLRLVFLSPFCSFVGLFFCCPRPRSNPSRLCSDSPAGIFCVLLSLLLPDTTFCVSR